MKINMEQLKNYVNVAAAIIAVGALTFSILDFKEIGMFIFRDSIWVAIASSVYAAIFAVYVSRMRERKLRQRRIFIIYSSKDKETASRIVKHLRDSGYNPWFDVDEITPGQKWDQSIMKGISESAVALYLVSENLNNSSQAVSEELKAAMSVMRSRDDSFSPIIPVRLDDTTVPKELADVHWVDLRNDNGLEQLDKGLKRLLGKA